MQMSKLLGLFAGGILISSVLVAQEMPPPPQCDAKGPRKDFRGKNMSMPMPVMPMGENFQGNPEEMGMRMEMAEKMFHRFAAENPDKAKELEKLRRINPQEFRMRMEGIARDQMEKEKKERDEIKELVGLYRETKSEDVKNKIAEKLKAQLNARLEVEKKMLAQMEEKCKKMKERVEKRENNRDEMVKSKLDNLLEDPDMKW
jgi:hypothetical protein